jgi:GNAT superfamily N-acetyltransferase
MSAVVDVYPLSRFHLAPAAQMLGRALFDEPVWAYVLSSPGQRARDLVWLAEMGLRYGERFGEVFVTGSPVTGAAVWLPPGETTITSDRLDEVGFAAAPARLGPLAFARFDRFIGHLARMHAALMSRPHWYLMLIGVEPSLQRRDTASLLLQPALERADRDGMPCYLETTLEGNIPSLARHGFNTIAEMNLADAPRTWLLVREAKRRNASSGAEGLGC